MSGQRGVAVRWSTAAATLVALAAACGGGASPSGSCRTNDECTGGRVCVDGRCDDADAGDDGLDADGGSDAADDATVAPGDDAATPDDVSGADADAEPEDGAEDEAAGDAGDDGAGDAEAEDGPPPCEPSPEVCGTGIDEDCDGFTDEEDCLCRRGTIEPCYDGPWGTVGRGICRGGARMCVETGVWGACEGQVVPAELPEATCDGIDNDCDGATDGGVANACGECAGAPTELCANSFDDDCDGLVDEDCACDPLCLLPDPALCHPPVNQPCYEGPPPTLGFGICTGGIHDCRYSGGAWSWTPCTGQVLPAVECSGGANGVDDDCDGLSDEDCLLDGDGDGYPPPSDCNDRDPSVSPAAAEICDGIDNDCDGVPDDGVLNGCGGCWVPAPEEICDDGYDNDCDGLIEEECACPPGDERWCYGGPPGTEDRPPCRAGEQTCAPDGQSWETCNGAVLPGIETCNGADDDCDGLVDERGAAGANPCGECVFAEACDEVDNDCDGLTDEGLRNGCGECLPIAPESRCDGLDDDCDGLTDEGLVNACGDCPPAECFLTDYPDPGLCTDPGRTCTGTEPWPDDPTSITLGEAVVRTPFIYIAVTGRNQVAKLNTETGARIWQVSSWGTWPSRTAVALDYTVWVANRGFGNVWNPTASNLAHLDADGNLICRADVTGLARGVAIDGDGNVWGGTWDGTSVWKISGTDVDRTLTPPRCRVLTTTNVGVNVYGLAVDGSGYLWTASAPNTVKLDTRTGGFVLAPNPSWYGIAPDRAGNVWFGGWSAGGPVHRILASPPYTLMNTAVSQVTAVAVDSSGYVWGSGYGTNRVYKIDPTTGAQVCSAAAPTMGGGNPHGIALDAAGKVWSPNRYGGYVNRFNPDCTLDATFPVDPGYELYTYSDMTGMQLRTVTTREGHWIQNYDSGYANPVWGHIEWTADVPPDTTLEITAKAADSEAELTTAPTAPCGPFTTSPADLTACPWLNGHRWLQLDIRLTTVRDGVRPVVHDIRVYWSY